MKNCVLKGNKNIIKIANDLGVSEDFVRTIAMENPSLSDKGLFFETAKTINRIALNTRVNSNNEGISSNSFVNHVRNRIKSNAVFNYNTTESAVEVSILNGEPLITIDSNLSRATVDSLIANTSAQELLNQILPELDALSDLFTSDNQLKSFLMRYASLVVENGLPNIFAVEGVLSGLTSPEAQVKVLSEAYKQSIKDVSDYPLSSAMLFSENAKEKEYGNNIRNYHNIVRSFLGNNAQLIQRSLRNNEALNKVLSFLGVDMTVRKTSIGVFFTPEKSNTQLSLEDKYTALETLFQSYLSEAESQDDTALPKFTEFGEEVNMRRLTDLINRYITDKFANQHVPLIRRVPFKSLPLGMVNNYTAMKAVLDLLERQYGFDMTELQDAIEDSYVSNFDAFLTDVFTHLQSLNNTNPRKALPFQINLANPRLKKLVEEAKLQDTQNILDSLKKTVPQNDSLESLISAVSPDLYVNHIFSGILDTLRTKVKHGKSTFNSQFISLLENIISNNNFIKYATIEVSDSLPEGKYGEYYEEDNKIVLSSKIPNIPELGINFENVLIHEILHAATINAPTALKKKLSSFLDIVNAQIRTNLENEITNSKGYKNSKKKKAYLEGKINEFYTDINYQSLTKPMEFLADFFRNKELASLLNDLDATGTVVVRKKGIFETIVDFIKGIFRLKRPNKETTALDEASQLVNDAIVLGSQTARSKISDYAKARDRVVRVKKLNRANMLHKVGKTSENIKYLPKILKSLEETRPDIASKLLDRELNTYKGISPMIQYLYSLYESGVIDTSDLTTINNYGVFSKDFLKRALEYMQKDNFEGYVAFVPKNLKSNLTIKETILLREAGRITAKPIAKYNNHFYSVVVKRNGNYDLNNLQAREKIEVSFKDGIVRRADNGQILEDIYSPIFFAEKPPTKDLQMIQAYDNDMTVVNTKVRALVREISYILDELLEVKQRTVPTMTREKMINSLTFDQLRELVYNRLQYYSDNSDDSNRESVGIFSEHIDALIARTLPHLQFTEKLTFKSRYLKNKNKKQEESDVELPDDKTAEEDSEGDDLLEAGETQSIQYNIKADTRKIFDKTSVKLKKVLYNLVDINGTPEEVTGTFPTIDVNLVKDVLLEALDSIFDPNDIMIALEYYSEAYPFLLDLIDQIEDDPTLLTQIYNTFTLTRIDALSVKPDMKHPFQKVNHVFLKTNKITSWAANVSEGVRLDPDYYVTSGTGVQNKAQLSERIKKVVKLAAEVRQELKTLPRLTEQERENLYPGIVERLMHIIHSVGVESSRDRLFVHLKGTLHELKDPMKKALKLVNIISSSLSVVEKNVNKSKATLYTSQEISHSLSKMFSRVYTELQSIDFQRGESYVNEGGKGYYLNRQPSYISKMLDGFKTNKPWLNTQEKIERRREFLNKHFFRYPGTYARINPIKANNREIRFFSDFIERMANDPDFANNNTYVSFKNINISGTRTEFKDLSENMQLAVLMSGFFSNEKVKVSEYKDALMDSSEAYFPFNNFSDSPELGFIKGIRYTGENYKDRINTNLTNLAISELKRISVVKKAKEEGVMPDVANLSERGDTFVKFPFLEEIKDELLGLLDTAPTEIHGRIKAFFETYLEGLANEFTDSILYETEDGVVFKVPEVQSIVAHGKTLSGQDYKDRLIEYYYNQYNAYAEFTHFLGIDHAMYKNAVEFQKRFKQVYSHGVPLNTSAKIPEVTVDMNTGNIISTGEFVKTGKSKRVTVVLSDYKVFSSVSNEMIKSITEAFPGNINQRVKILSSLGVYNHGEMVIGEDTYARSVTLGTFIKNGTQITGEEYFEVMGENPGAEKKYYIDAEDPDNMYETQRMNITDGQTFLSLSEMRSMMSMYDNWTIENEIEFQKYQVYKENDVPTEGIFSKFYNSIKSFYFGTAPLKVNGENLKINVQFKHSEALLAPNSIMGGSELLQNISRFLENPPTVMVDGVEYQVGAISFDSTQKTGSHNVVNINDLNPADVEQTLRNAVADGKYTVTDYSNYIIQQPTPNHITNNTKQLVGTQSRRILYADIPSNATFEIAGKVYNKEEYTDIVNNLVNKGIRKSFDKLQKRFGDNEALSELLIDTVLSSNLYHKDLVNAFKLDKHGNFKLPLFNPANSVMVERMITSIIRTNVTKQYIRGGKVVNTSNIGYSEDLKILFETKNGKLIPTFFEVYAPFPGTEQEWRKLHDSDGNFLWENVDPKFREMVFYRIPTESKYSIVPVRVKEFLPPSSGVSFILPNEISTLTGLDFDIDAMYGFINDYTFSKGKLSVIPSSNPDDFLSDDLRLKRRAAQSSLQQSNTTVKDGVSELFESNPELANAIYEALGFKTKADVILPIGTSGSGKSTWIKSLPQENLVVIEPDAMRVEFTGDMNNKSTDKEIYEEAAKRAIAAIKQGKQVVFDTTNLTKDKRLPFIKAIKEAIPAANIQYKLMELNPELAKQRIKAQLARGENRAAVSDETIDRHAASYRQMLDDIKNEPISNFEITPQQKQQAQQQYSEYLDTIFPDSKVKDIVYRGDKSKTINGVTQFIEGERTDLLFLTTNEEVAKNTLYHSDFSEFIYKKNEFGDLMLTNERKPDDSKGLVRGPKNFIAAIVDIQKPLIKNAENQSYKNYKIEGKNEYEIIKEAKEKIKNQENDSVIVENVLEGERGILPSTTIGLSKPEQIHILGDRQDIEGFKKFTKGLSSSSVSPTIRRSTNTSDNNLLIDLFLSNLNNEFSVQERFKLGGFDELMEKSYEIALLRQGYTRKQLEEMDRMPNPLRHKRNLVESASRDMNAIENDLFFRNQSIVGMNNVPIFVNNRSFKNFLSSLKDAYIQLNRNKGHVVIQTELVRLLVKGAEYGKIPLIRAEYVDDDGNIRRSKDDVSEDTAAAVDIAKSPVHPNIGLNPYNTQAYTALRFIGADSRKINSIMANPLISWEIPYRFKLLRKPGSVFDTVKAFVSIYDYKLGYDLLNPKLDATSLKRALQAATRRAGIENKQVENMSMELLEESMNYLARSINTIAHTLSEFSNVNKTDAVNNGPSLSIENMVKTNLQFNRVIRDSNKALKVVTTEDFDNNFVVNFHDYTFNRALNTLDKNFNVKVMEKVYTILDMFSENTEVVQAIYLSYAYDNVKMYNGSAVNKLVLDAFPNYFIENLRSDPKYNDSWLLNNLEHDTEAFFINAYQKPDKDKIIGDWVKMFNDPNHREDAYNLAVYSYFRRSSTKGLNNLYYMIPSDIQTELNLFPDINDNPELLDEYILSESIAKVSANTKYIDKLKDMASYFPASEIMDGDIVERVLEIIGKQIADGTYVSSFYKINKDIYYYDAANHNLILLSDLRDYLPATLKEKTNIIHDDINKEEREIVEENRVAMESPSETDVIDEMTYDTEVFSSKYYKDIKQIETLTGLLDSMEAAIINLQQSEDPLQQDVYSAGVSYLEIVSENYDEFPEFEGMTSEEIEREINEAKSCLL